MLFDNWSNLSSKSALRESGPGPSKFMHPVWTVGHQRRLSAYLVLSAYLDNCARELLDTTDQDIKSSHREYGDATLIRDTVLDALLGNSQEISTDDAEEGNDQQVLQDWLSDLWATERGGLKLIEAERNAVGLGDAVYSIGWSPEKSRPRVRVWSPGFYFPVLTDGNEDDFPERVHIAWELEQESTSPGKAPRKVIRRLTWELVDRLDGPVVYPWSDGQPSTKTCLYSDATFEYDLGGKTGLENLDPKSAVYTDDHVDMGIDFIPVIHVPNTVSVLDHYGKSSLASVVQILDDIAAADTDLASAGVTVANPQLILSKASLAAGEQPSYEPGKVWAVGDGNLSALDTSKSLVALISLIDHLYDRLCVNARTPAALLGRVKPSEVPSGVAMALSFGPLTGMVTKMRLSREDKYPLLLKFLWRIALSGGMPDVPTTWYPSQLVFGSYLPSDIASVVELVVKLRSTSPPVISAETAVSILVQAGMDIDEAKAEVERIEQRDFAGAVDLRSAVDANAAADYLGREAPVTPVLPPIQFRQPPTDPSEEPVI